MNKGPAPKLGTPGGHTIHEVSAETISWRAHLPPPQIVEAYNRLVPTFAEDLHREALKETTHRRSCDSWLIKGGTMLAFSGQICALIIVLAGFVLAGFALQLGYQFAAIAIVGIDLLGIAGAFLGRSIINRKADAAQESKNDPIEAVPPPAQTEPETPPPSELST